MLIFEELANIKSFSDIEQIIADYIIENPHSFIKSNIQEVANTLYCSPGTISKFVNKYFQISFSDFKVQLAHDIALKSLTVSKEQNNIKSVLKDSNEIFDFLFTLHSSILKETKIKIDHKLLSDFSKKILNNRSKTKIIIFAEGFNYIAALEFQKLCERIDINCIVVEPYLNGLIEAANLHEESIPILISHSGNNEKIIKIAKIVEKNKIEPLILTTSKATELGKMFKDVQVIVSSNNGFTEFSIFYFTTSTQYILRILFSLLYIGDYSQNKKLIEKSLKMLGYD